MPLNCILKMVKKANFMLYIFYHDKKNGEDSLMALIYLEVGIDKIADRKSV